MAIELPEETDDELEPGELAYEVLADTFAALDAATVMHLVTAIQQGAEWSKVPVAARAACVELENQLFAEE